MQWTRVNGSLEGDVVDVSDSWRRAVAAAQRALSTEVIAITEQILRIAVEHAKTRMQFGTPIGSFQSPRHALADACAALEGARALVGESWRYGGRVSAQAAKAAAGRAHRAVSGTALQVLGAIGLTAEHDLHRYVSRGFQLDALFGSYQELETLLAEQLFNVDKPGEALPAIVACG
jgi:alkylation response protein AidB-like acyl-CoA dehydrogenase